MIKFCLNTFLIVCFFSSYGQLSADFDVVSETQGCAPFVVEFTDISSGGTSWVWDFGNGFTSNEQNPTYVYSQPGFYTVSLTVSDGTSSDIETKFSLIRVNPSPIADFSVDDEIGCSPHHAQFTDLSVPLAGTIKEWFWAFGNGESSTETNPLITYSVIKDYDVFLKVIDANGCEGSVSKTNFIKLDGPEAKFIVSDSVACGLPASITFVNKSIGNDLEYFWDFGDGTSSTGDIPGTHDYTSFDSLSAILLVTEKKTGCSDTFEKSLIVGNYEAKFDWDIICFGDSNKFVIEVQNQTEFYNSLQWNFEGNNFDPNESNKEKTSHLYLTRGPHNITLEAKVNSSCWDTTTITYGLPRASFSYSSLICQAPFEVTFNNTSSGKGLSYNWNFGDSTFSVEKKPKHTYEIPPETFRTILTVKDTFGCEKSALEIVKVPFPIARFYEVDSIYTGCAPLNLTFKDTSYTMESKISYREWIFVDLSTGDSVTSYDSIPNHTFENPGEYDITYIIFTDSEDACSDTNIFRSIIKVGEKPNSASFEQLDNDTICYGGFIQFIDTAFYSTESIESNYFCYAFEEDQNPLLLNPESPPLECENASYPGNPYYNGENPLREYNEFNNEPIFQNNYYYSGKILTAAGQLHTHLFIGYNNCLEEVINPTFVDTTIAINGYALPDTFLLFADTTVDIGFYQASMNYDSIAYSYVYKNSKNDTFFKIPSTDTIFKQLEEGHKYGIKTKVVNKSSLCENEIIDIFPVDSSRLSIEIPERWCLSGGPARLVDLSFSKLGFLTSRIWKVDNETIISSLDNDTSFYQFPDTGNYTVSLELGYEVSYTLYGKEKIGRFIKTISDKIRIEGVKASGYSDTNLLCKGNILNLFSTSKSTTIIDSYKWYFGYNTDSTVTQNTSHLYNIPGEFVPILFVADTFGCIDSVEIPEVTISNPNIMFNMTDSLICEGELISFTNNSEGKNLSFIWTIIDSMPQLNRNIDQKFDHAGLYSVKLYAKDYYGCEDSVIKQDVIEVASYPEAKFNSSHLYSDCPPLTTNFLDTAYTTAVSWLWNFGDGNYSTDKNHSHTYTSPGLYDISLIVTNYAACQDTLVKNEYIRIDGPSGHITYLKDSICLPDDNTFILDLQNTKYYTINYDDGNIISYDYNLHSDSIIYSYKNGGTFQPIFDLIDDKGCIFRLPLTSVILADSIDALFQTSSNIICDISNIPFENKSRYNLTPEFTWNFGDTNTSNDISPIHSYEKDSTYEITLALNSPIGCRDTLLKSIIVYNNPKPMLNLINNNFCIPSNTEFKLNYGNDKFSPDSTYFLINDTEKIMGDSAFYTFLDTGLQSTKFVIHFGEGNCLIDSVLNLNFYDYPEAKFNYSSSEVSLEEPTIIFEDQSINSTSQYWNFGDSDTSEIKNPGHSFKNSGLYDVRLIVSNYGQCYDTTFKQISVAPENFVKLSSGFSPNGDGKNETFRILSAGSIELISFKIFNRWGNIVFETNNIEDAWDGKRNGKDQNSGTYIYYIEAKDKDGKFIERHGNFTLLR